MTDRIKIGTRTQKQRGNEDTDDGGGTGQKPAARSEKLKDSNPIRPNDEGAGHGKRSHRG